jgi:hypothetical protein
MSVRLSLPHSTEIIIINNICSVFMILGMNIMPVEISTSPCYLTPRYPQNIHGNRVHFGIGTTLMLLNVMY